MVDSDGMPYIVPLNFGYENRSLYFHSAREGRKIDILRTNSRVCIEFCPDHELVLGDGACECTMKYRSVIAFGRASIVEDDAGRRAGYDILMRQYKPGPYGIVGRNPRGFDSASEPQGIGPTEQGQWRYVYKEKSLAKSLIIKVEVDSMTGKMSGY